MVEQLVRGERDDESEREREKERERELSFIMKVFLRVHFISLHYGAFKLACGLS